MASIYDEIRAALDNRLNDTVGIPEIAWENSNYSPTTGTPFIKQQFIPTLREPAVRGLNPQHLYVGLYRLILHYPINTYSGTANNMADILVDRFSSTLDLSYGSVFVSIRKSERFAGYSDNAWYKVPVDITWYSYA